MSFSAIQNSKIAKFTFHLSLFVFLFQLIDSIDKSKQPAPFDPYLYLKNKSTSPDQLQSLETQFCSAKYYYQVFSVANNASIEEIKRAWKAKVKSEHPDKNRDNPHCQVQYHRIKVFNDKALKILKPFLPTHMHDSSLLKQLTRRSGISVSFTMKW